MSFKDDVEYFLKKGNNNLNYYGLDVNTCNIAEDDDGGDEGGEEASKSTEKKTKKKAVCPGCGCESDKCECAASKSTGTKGGDDDNDGYASVATKEVEVAKAIEKLRAAGMLGKNFRASTPEEKELVLILASKIPASKNTGKDDKGVGCQPSVKTNSLKEEILKRL